MCSPQKTLVARRATTFEMRISTEFGWIPSTNCEPFVYDQNRFFFFPALHHEVFVLVVAVRIGVVANVDDDFVCRVSLERRIHERDSRRRLTVPVPADELPRADPSARDDDLLRDEAVLDSLGRFADGAPRDAARSRESSRRPSRHWSTAGSPSESFISSGNSRFGWARPIPAYDSRPSVARLRHVFVRRHSAHLGIGDEPRRQLTHVVTILRVFGRALLEREESQPTEDDSRSHRAS